MKNKVPHTNSFVGFIAKHFGMITVVIIALYVLGLILYVSPSHPCTINNATLLDYFGNFLLGLITILLGIVALHQSYEASRFQYELEDEKRKRTIMPNLRLHIRKNADLYAISLSNYSDYRADHVYLFEESFCPYVLKGDQPIERNCAFLGISEPSENSNADIFVHSMYCEEETDGFPKLINLIFSDVDGNLISQEFAFCPEGEYEITSTEYVEEKNL